GRQPGHVVDRADDQPGRHPRQRLVTEARTTTGGRGMKGNRTGGRLRLAAALGMLVCLAATGCGSNGSVSGKLSYKGEPLGGGVVVFTVEGQANASSEIGPDGSYHIDKIPVGTAKIAVDTSSAKPPPADFRRPQG